jgi:hypothetical protein
MKDPVVEEVRKLREEHAARFNYEVYAIFEDLRNTEREANRPVVSLTLGESSKLAKALLSCAAFPQSAPKSRIDVGPNSRSSSSSIALPTSASVNSPLM